MRELVGNCDHCHKEIYCLDGFLNGVKENGKLLCFECDEKEHSE
ncbi:ribosomal protein L24E [Oikeobacillus pervagus]|uniref:Ribosomal protein L24E n=1 Tax=Oikeobacillus pervagus TaxID=1325931 RepID=A0AAJ1WJD1_9BACI|nr:hypothetical protein [Oikeobacillus pervagus]MDQ0215323.1 ribosomal protein L24E [Oikeobacillus pervagus]